MLVSICLLCKVYIWSLRITAVANDKSESLTVCSPILQFSFISSNVFILCTPLGTYFSHFLSLGVRGRSSSLTTDCKEEIFAVIFLLLSVNGKKLGIKVGNHLSLAALFLWCADIEIRYKKYKSR